MLEKLQQMQVLIGRTAWHNNLQAVAPPASFQQPMQQFYLPSNSQVHPACQPAHCGSYMEPRLQLTTSQAPAWSPAPQPNLPAMAPEAAQDAAGRPSPASCSSSMTPMSQARLSKQDLVELRKRNAITMQEMLDMWSAASEDTNK